MIASDVKYLVVHCSATPASMDVGAKEIDRWHRQRGFLRIGYHFVIRRDGKVEDGRVVRDDRDGTIVRFDVGAHVEGFNSKSLGICMVGGLTADGKKAQNNFTEAQFATLRSLLNELKSGDFKHAEVLGHRDLPNVHKDCPSFNVREWW